MTDQNGSPACLHPKDDPRTVDELIFAALSETDEDIAWDAVCALQYRGTLEVLRRAAGLCRSSCPHERRLGADMLGQLGVPERTFPEYCVNILINALSRERDQNVLRSILVAFSHLSDPRLIIPASRFRRHADPDVREAVALALGGYEDSVAVETLIELSRDSDPRVRDWATFALGTQTELDAPALREALLERLLDADDDARGEALVGLAKRGDQRVVSALSCELESDCVGRLAVEAAEIIADSRLYAPLLGLQCWWDVDKGLLARAIETCSPPTSTSAE
ncbi:MAG: HEAT repeat domain-containing protein [Pirellulales bacterium]